MPRHNSDDDCRLLIPTPPSHLRHNSEGSGTSGNEPSDTALPYYPSSPDSEARLEKIEAIRLAVRTELQQAWVVEDPATLPFQEGLKQKINAAYPDLAKRAEDWLVTPNSGYKDSRWTGIPRKAHLVLEAKLWGPIADALCNIVKAFGNESQPATGSGQISLTRTVKKTCLGHILDAEGNPRFKTSPDITIFGTGPSATKEAHLSEEGTYDEMATPIAIKLKEPFTALAKDQVSVYAREIFINQNNRRFVYVPLMAGKSIRVIQFDHSGAQVSQPIDYHDQPIFFIQLVVLFSSLDEKLLGYDTSIYWKNGKRMMEANDSRIEFEIFDKDGRPSENPRPLFARRTIRSRGTIYWRVQYEGRQLLVKDYWGVAARTPESDFLKEVAMVKGIGQLYAFKNNRDSTYGLRGFSADASLHSDIDSSCIVPNRISTRLVLKIYGSTLNRASSGLRLLRAVRDIVYGHRDVFLDKKILHRDISFDNLLLASGAEDGVLIDFDMVKTLSTEIMDKSKGDSQIGTQAYQSVKVLHLDPKLGHHDHMDDLESIFYVLVEVCFGHGEDGNILPIVPRYISHWFSNIEPGFLAEVKSALLRSPFRMAMTRFSGGEKKIFRPLMNQLRLFFGKRLDTICNALQAEDPIPFPLFSADVASEDYAKFIGLIENAIQSLEQLSGVSLPSPGHATSLGFKRRHDSEERPTTPWKRRRSRP
ncbi:hypothetical protein C8R47DRAFT_1326191 [Mycena vitilis]|nr:hypothetical protein C8R47DRAFT_1326191 [Mycena vitilis]